MAAPATVQHPSIRKVRRFGSVQLGPAAKAGIAKPQRFQLFKSGLINFSPLALVIGCLGTTGATSLVPGKAQPTEVLLQQVAQGTAGALRVQVPFP